ncbi:MAG: hypothetical protein E7513_01515 [Ruminococcaceae bacterium]|nr:hypothetical protein [Oscillospiraceae bacterium]
MKNNRVSTIIFTVVALVLVAIMVSGCGGVDKEYEYNTEIIINENAPVEGEPQLESITGYVEDTKQDFLKLPYAIENTSLEIVSIGKYTGVYTDSGSNENVEDILAIVVKNVSDKVVSYSNVSFAYGDDVACSFSPTNLPPNQSALVFTNTEKIPYKNVKKFECVDAMEVPAEKLPLLEDKVGVDFKDGEFIITNLTNENLGDVYVRYKNFTDGNAYLGGITYSVVATDVEPYETYKVPADNYNAETSVIIAVENYTN